MARKRIPTAEQKLARCHLRLMRSKAFCALSGILVSGDSRICDTTPTAYTDGWNKVYGRRFFEALSDEEAAFVVAHEHFHVLLRQLTVWQSLFQIDPHRANQAADYVINQMIVDLDPEHEIVQPPAGVLLDERYRGKDTGQVFRALARRQTAQRPSLDEHGWHEARAVSQQESAQRERILDRALRQGRVLARTLGSPMPKAFDDLTATQVDWREQLRDFVVTQGTGQSVSTWRRPSRRGLSVGEYRPGQISEGMGTLVVAIDTSGSIDSWDIARFLSEVVAICETVTPERLDLMCWDTKVAVRHHFQAGEYAGLEARVRPEGGGGTDPRCVFELLAQEPAPPDCVLMLTDGWIENWGAAPPYPVMWATTTGSNAPWGVSIDLS